MNYFTIRLLPFVTCLLLVFSGHAASFPALILQDSFPVLVDDAAYTGNRLAVSNIEILKAKANSIKLKYNLVNTGRNNISLQGKTAPDFLVINFDETLETANLAPYSTLIKQQLLRENINIKTGQVLINNELKFNPKKKSSNPAKVALAKKGKTEKTVKPAFTDAVGKTNSQNYLDENFCPDLIFTELKVLKKSKKWITLSYTILNQGKGPAAMLGDKKAESDNVAIKAYIAGSPKITRGSLVLGGDFLSKGFEDAKGLLAPQESYSGTIKLDCRKQTRFTPFVVVELDSFQSIKECDETNNTASVMSK